MKKPTQAEISAVRQKIFEALELAHETGLNFSVDVNPLYPLATGRHVPKVCIWMKREFTRPE